MKLLMSILCALAVASGATARTAEPFSEPVGIAPNAEEMDARAGAPPVAVVVFGTGAVVMLRSCWSNTLCRLAATTAAKQGGTYVANYVYERNETRLKRAACRIGVRRYC